jgi:hypothetical protein
MAPTLDLRKGARVLYQNAIAGEWSEGVLMHGSTTGEEWLVKDRFGEYWVSVTQLRPATGPQPGH